MPRQGAVARWGLGAAVAAHPAADMAVGLDLTCACCVTPMRRSEKHAAQELRTARWSVASSILVGGREEHGSV